MMKWILNNTGLQPIQKKSICKNIINSYVTGLTTKEIDQQKSLVEVPKHGQDLHIYYQLH